MSVGGVAVSALMAETRGEHTITTMITMVIEAVVIVVVDDNLGGDGERRRQQHAGGAVDAVCKNSQKLRISANRLYQPALPFAVTPPA